MKKTHRIFSALLAILMVLAVCPIIALPALAESKPDVWDGTAATAFAGGSGTEADPYLIANAEQLAYLANSVNNGNNYAGKYLKLTADIWLNDITKANWSSDSPKAWSPIGLHSGAKFEGYFDGDGYAVYGLCVNDALKPTLLESTVQNMVDGKGDYAYYVKTGEKTADGKEIVDAYYGMHRESFLIYYAGLFGATSSKTFISNVALVDCYVDVNVGAKKTEGDIRVAKSAGTSLNPELSTKFTGKYKTDGCDPFVSEVSLGGTTYSVGKMYLSQFSKATEGAITEGKEYFAVKNATSGNATLNAWTTATAGTTIGYTDPNGNHKFTNIAALAGGDGHFSKIYVKGAVKKSGGDSDGGLVLSYVNGGSITDVAANGTCDMATFISGAGGVKVSRGYATGSGRLTGWVAGASTWEGVYATNIDSIKSTKTGAYANAALKVDQMKGEAAKTNMPALFGSEDVWTVYADTFPIQKIFTAKHTEAEIKELFFGIKSEPESELLEIATAADLVKFSEAVNNGNDYSGKTVKLTADIDMSGVTNFKPIGYLNTRPFAGTFDGQGHVIKGLRIEGVLTYRWTQKYGFFGMLKNATLKNFLLYDYEITVTRNVPTSITGQDRYVYAGALFSDADTSATIENVGMFDAKLTQINVTKNADGTISNQEYRCGAFCGYTGATVKIKNSFFVGTLEKGGDSSTWGGMADCAFFAGVGGSSSVENSYVISNRISAYAWTHNAKNLFTNSYTIKNGAGKLHTSTGTEYKTSDVSLADMQKSLLATNAYTMVEGYAVSTAVKDSFYKSFTAYSGAGTAENPYLISTAAQFRKFMADISSGNKFEGKYIKLANDIYLNTDAAPTATKHNANGHFNGTFDGAGHTLYNLYMESNGSGEPTLGLFAYTDGKAVIKNLSVMNAKIVSNGANDWIGVISCCPANTTIENVYVKADIERKTADAWKPTGGIVGWSNGVTMKNVMVEGTMKLGNGTACHMGAFISGCSGTNVLENCLSTMTLTVGKGGQLGLVAGNGIGNITAKNVYVVAEGSTYLKDGVAAPLTIGIPTGAKIVTKDQLRGFVAEYTLDGFDFENTWTVAAGKYPVLALAKIAQKDAEAFQDITAGTDLNLLGASIRYTGSQGLRFKAQFNKSVLYQNFVRKGSNYAYAEDGDFIFGILIVPTSFLGDGEKLTIANKDAFNIVADKIYSQNDETLCFTGAIVNIPASTMMLKDGDILEVNGYDISYTAVAYCAYREAGATEYTYLYSDAMVRSCRDVALACYEAQTAEVKEALKKLYPDFEF